MHQKGEQEEFQGELVLFPAPQTEDVEMMLQDLYTSSLL